MASENQRREILFKFAEEVCRQGWDDEHVAQSLWVAMRLLKILSSRKETGFNSRLRLAIETSRKTGRSEPWKLQAAARDVTAAAEAENAFVRLAAAMPDGVLGVLVVDARPVNHTPPSCGDFGSFVRWVVERLHGKRLPPKSDAPRLRKASIRDDSADSAGSLHIDPASPPATHPKRRAAPALATSEPTHRSGAFPSSAGSARTTPSMGVSAAPPLLPSAASPAVLLAEVPAVDAPCTLGGVLQAALDVPPEAVERALDESARAERRARAAEIAAGLDALDGRLALAPFAAPVAPGGLVLRGEESLRDREIWAIGDLHGDLLGLECCVAAIERAAEGRPHLVVLLGDLIDDGPLSYDTMLRAMELFVGAPDRFALLVGNHDVALSFDEAAASFSSDVEPGDLADALNAMENERAVAAARSFVRLAARAPRALFLPDGTLAAHGGVPQSDRWTGLTTPADLDGRSCRDDFVWCRAHERAKRRLPSRGLRGAEFGREDFAAFCALATERLGLPTGRMLRGHDHFEQRFCLYELYAANPIVGVNAMCRRLERELFGPPARRPVVARWRAGETIDLFPVGVPEAAVAAMFGAPETDAAADAVPEAGS